jgi:NAD(P)H-hydrate epimerase
MPSGLRGEDNGGNVEKNIVKAAHTLTFQFPRLSFMFPDNYKFTGEWHLIDIQLHPEAIRNTATNYSLIEKKDINLLLKKRGKFDHKGTFGHGLLIAGSEDKAGAAVLAAKAALRSGIGLITCLLPSKAGAVIQSTLPEAMTISFTEWTKKKETGSADIYSAIGAGPGMGTGDVQTRIVEELLIMKKPAVIDADALNILGKNKKLLSLLHPSVILTPHLKEFERIAGKAANGYERLMLQKNFSDKYSCIVVLKGANSSITLPDGRVIFNSSGNPGMATAGSGDVLTGIILSLLSQGYRPEDATLAGVYLHGLAGDLAADKLPWESVISSDIIDNIGNAFKDLRADKL